MKEGSTPLVIKGRGKVACLILFSLPIRFEFRLSEGNEKAGLEDYGGFLGVY